MREKHRAKNSKVLCQTRYCLVEALVCIVQQFDCGGNTNNIESESVPEPRLSRITIKLQNFTKPTKPYQRCT